MTITLRTIIAALILSLLGIAASRAQDNPQTASEATGAWRLVARPDTASGVQDFALVTPAIGEGDTEFALACRTQATIFLLEIKTPRLSAYPADEAIRISIKFLEEDQVWFNVTTGAGGTVLIQERTHQTAFELILMALLQSNAQAFEFSAGDHRWRFSLDGLKTSFAALTQRCGFLPDPERARARPRRGR